MEYFFIAYLAMLVFLFTKLRRLQHSPSFQAAFGLLIFVPLVWSVVELQWPWPLETSIFTAITGLVMAFSMFYLGRALFHQPISSMIGSYLVHTTNVYIVLMQRPVF